MNIYYEWDIEEVDEHSDIQDHDFQDNLKDYGVAPMIDGERYQLVLVRNVGNIEEGMVDRTWAYAEKDAGKWKLPMHFEDGVKVPEKYHAEINKFQG